MEDDFILDRTFSKRLCNKIVEEEGRREKGKHVNHVLFVIMDITFSERS